MSQHSNESTLQVQGFTPYSQVPRWVLRSGGKLSHGAVRLYGVIMSYTDSNDTVAFPGQTRLAEDMGCGMRSIYTYMKELESFGALIIQKRRNERWGQFKSNNYVLVFNDPSAVECGRPSATDCGLSKPNSYLDPDPSTSDLRSDATVARAHSVSAPQNEPGNLPGPVRALLRRQIQKIGIEVHKGHSYWSERVSVLEAQLLEDLDHYCQHIPGIDGLVDAINCGKVTIGAKEADPYYAGAKLNKLINMAPMQP